MAAPERGSAAERLWDALDAICRRRSPAQDDPAITGDVAPRARRSCACRADGGCPNCRSHCLSRICANAIGGPVFDWADATAAAIGTVAHRLLAQIAGEGLVGWNEARLRDERAAHPRRARRRRRRAGSARGRGATRRRHRHAHAGRSARSLAVRSGACRRAQRMGARRRGRRARRARRARPQLRRGRRPLHRRLQDRRAPGRRRARSSSANSSAIDRSSPATRASCARSMRGRSASRCTTRSSSGGGVDVEPSRASTVAARYAKIVGFSERMPRREARVSPPRNRSVRVQRGPDERARRPGRADDRQLRRRPSRPSGDARAADRGGRGPAPAAGGAHVRPASARVLRAASAPPRLSTLRAKLELFRAYGVATTFVARFDARLASLTAGAVRPRRARAPARGALGARRRRLPLRPRPPGDLAVLRARRGASASRRCARSRSTASARRAPRCARRWRRATSRARRRCSVAITRSPGASRTATSSAATSAFRPPTCRCAASRR